MEQFWLFCGIFLLFVFIIKSCCFNPFKYPRCVIYFDISGKRQPVYEDYVDEWIIDLFNSGYSVGYKFDDILRAWDSGCKSYLEHCLLWRSRRKKIYETMRESVLDDEYKMFKFIFIRKQTRYRQKNYRKYSYVVENKVKKLSFSLQDLVDITNELDAIGYETTRAKWNMKNQRKLMTKELKDKIKKRDNYTCQKCGKYMPDEVGLHVDHIIPVKLGGKSVESNLQVLCDKCNLSKGSKVV